MTRSLLNHHSVRQALAIGLGVLAVALVFGLLIYAGGGNSASAGNSSPPTEASPYSLAPSSADPTNTPTPDPNATATPTPTPVPPTPTPTPELHPTPQACPDTTENPQHTAEVVASGDHAMFDVYWSSATVNLTTNPCPPNVHHNVTEHTDPDTGETTKVMGETIRTASNINLDTTVIHVPEGTKQTLSDDAATYKTDYPFLYDDTDGDGTVDTLKAGIEEFWVLPYCDPTYSGYVRAEGDMCMGFSTGLLHKKHWLATEGGQPPGQIRYEFESEREPGVHYNDKGRVFVFLPHDLPEVTRTEDAVPQVTWDTLDVAEDNTLAMAPGTYEHRHWGFTKPGTYEFSVHAWGYPESALGAVGAQSVSSVPRLYTFHVGLLADLSVSATADDSAPDHGDTVTYTITASSKGPDAADNTKVNVHLPPGLTYASATTATGSYDSATGVWSVGDLAAPAAGETTTTATLTLQATVDSDAALGEALDTGLEIFATEDIGAHSHVRELDPHTHDNAATVSVTPPAADNKPPYFYVSRSVTENSSAGTNVGAPVVAGDPNSDDTLSYSLSGTGAELFTVSTVATGAQIQVASGVNVNYEDASHYDLTLGVSDGKDADGNDDTAVDATITVRVNVTDVASESLAASLVSDRTTQTVGENVTFTVLISANPSPTSWLSFRYDAQNNTGDVDLVQKDFTGTTFTVTYDTPVNARDYFVNVIRNDDGDEDYPLQQVNTGTVGIHWTAANSGGGAN